MFPCFDTYNRPIEFINLTRGCQNFYELKLLNCIYSLSYAEVFNKKTKLFK